jgi:beta-galactosidase
VDVMAYFNCEEVELFLNGESQGIQNKKGDALHAMWRLKFVPGTIKAVGRTDGEVILTQEINTAGDPAKIQLNADRSNIIADGNDLSFVTVSILDAEGNLVPYADNLVNFEIEGKAKIAGVDNGSQTSHEPFHANYRKAFNGMCLVVIRAGKEPGPVKLKATAQDLKEAIIELKLK